MLERQTSLKYSRKESEVKHSAVMIQIMKLNEFTVECKMIIVVFLARLVLAVGNKPRLTRESKVNAAVLAGLLQAAVRSSLQPIHPSPAAPQLSPTAGRPAHRDTPPLEWDRGGLMEHHLLSPCLGYLMWKGWPELFRTAKKRRKAVRKSFLCKIYLYRDIKCIHS